MDWTSARTGGIHERLAYARRRRHRGTGAACEGDVRGRTRGRLLARGRGSARGRSTRSLACRRRRVAAPIASPSGRRASAGRIVIPLHGPAAGRPLCRAPAAPAAAACAAHHPDNGARHRCDDGALQRGVWRADEAVSVAARRPDRRPEETRGGSAPRFGAFTNAAYLAWREEAATIEHIAAWSQRPVTLTGVGEPERIRITAATATLFPLLGARPLVGSFFEQKDETSPMIVLSEGLWRQRFSADPAVLGRSVHLDGAALHRRRRAAGQPRLPGSADPRHHSVSVRPTAGNSLSMFNAIATLRPGVTAAQAAAEGTARGRVAADTGMTTHGDLRQQRSNRDHRAAVAPTR